MGLTHVGLANVDRAMGHENEFSFSTTPTALAPSAVRGVLKVVIQVRDNDISFTDDGSTPSTTRGLIVKKDDILVYEASLEAIQALRAISMLAIAKVRVAYYGYGT